MTDHFSLSFWSNRSKSVEKVAIVLLDLFSLHESVYLKPKRIGEITAEKLLVRRIKFGAVMTAQSHSVLHLAPPYHITTWKSLCVVLEVLKQLTEVLMFPRARSLKQHYILGSMGEVIWEREHMRQELKSVV